MTCDEYFSLSNLDGSSYETEIGYSTLCVPNKLKAAVFITAITAFTGTFIAAIVLAVSEWMAVKSFNWKVQGNIIYIFQSLTLVIINALHLAGVQSVGRYILFFLPPTLVLTGGILKIDVWLATSSAIRKLVSPEDTTTKSKTFAKYAGITTLAVGMSLLGSILPMVYYDDKFSLNWFYCFFMFFIGLVGISTGFWILHLHWDLLSLCQRATGLGEETNETLLPTILKLKVAMKAVGVLCCILILLLLFPLWIGLTKTETDPGMKGHFYYHFFGFQLLLFFNALLSFFNHMKAPLGGKSSKGSSSDKPMSMDHRPSLSDQSNSTNTTERRASVNTERRASTTAKEHPKGPREVKEGGFSYSLQELKGEDEC